MYQCSCGNRNLVIQTEGAAMISQNGDSFTVETLPEHGLFWTKYSQMECLVCGYVNQAQYFETHRTKELADVS